MKRHVFTLLGSLVLLPCAAPLLADDRDQTETEKERREGSADRLIEMSIVLGRLQRLKSRLDKGEELSLEDLRGAVGRADGAQERLMSEEQALELLADRLASLRERGRAAEHELDSAGPAQEAPAPAAAELTVEEALQRMGPPSLPENSRELAHLLRGSGNYGLALDAYRRIPKSERTPWDRFHEAVCLEGLGNLSQARSQYRSVSLEARGTPLGEHARWIANTYLPMLASR